MCFSCTSIVCRGVTLVFHLLFLIEIVQVSVGFLNIWKEVEGGFSSFTCSLFCCCCVMCRHSLLSEIFCLIFFQHLYLDLLFPSCQLAFPFLLSYDSRPSKFLLSGLCPGQRSQGSGLKAQGAWPFHPLHQSPPPPLPLAPRSGQTFPASAPPLMWPAWLAVRTCWGFKALLFHENLLSVSPLLLTVCPGRWVVLRARGSWWLVLTLCVLVSRGVLCHLIIVVALFLCGSLGRSPNCTAAKATFS